MNLKIKSKMFINDDGNSWDDENLDLKNNLLRGIYSYGFENQVLFKN